MYILKYATSCRFMEGFQGWGGQKHIIPSSLAIQQESMQTEKKALRFGMISIVTANPDKVLLWLVLSSTFPFPKHDNFEDLLAV